MFDDSLLESARKPEKRRGVTALLAAAVQSGMVLIAVAIPLFVTERLQIQPLQAAIIAPTPPKGTPEPKAEPPRGPRKPADSTRPAFEQPPQIPDSVDLSPDPPAMLGNFRDLSDVVIGTVGDPNGDPRSSAPYIEGARVIAPPEPPARPPVISEAQLGAAIHKVQPRYPDIARRTRVQGDVVLRAFIGADGKVTSVEVMSGHPLLRSEAEQSVRRWKYRPYLLNGQPMAVESIITVRFKLN